MSRETEQKKSDFRPKFYDMLDPADQERYNELRATLSSHMCRNRRGKRLETFAEMLGAIKNFCVRNDENDWKRCLVCGVCWLPNGIGINNRQLSILIDKCKSSINGSLQKIGYTALQSRNESSESLRQAIPILKDNFNELREWTVRLFVAATPQPHLPLYNVNTIYPYQSPMPSQYQSGMYMQPPTPTPPASTPPAEPQSMIPPERPHSEDNDYFFDDDFCLPPSFLADENGNTGGDDVLGGYNDHWI